jgi:hypothetical protein
MAFQMNCPHCAKQLNVTEKAFGKTVPCPGCNWPIDVPRLPPVGVDQNFVNDNPVTRQCPHCGSLLRLVQQLRGKRVRCNTCGNSLTVSGDPLRLSLVGAESIALPAEADPPQPPRTAPMNVPSYPVPPPPFQKARQLPDVPACSVGTQSRPSSRAEAEVLVFRCPSCSRTLQAQRQFAGKAVTCSCGCNVQVPTLPSQLSPVDAEPSVVAPPTALGSLGLLGVIAAVSLLSSFLGTFLLRHS